MADATTYDVLGIPVSVTSLDAASAAIHAGACDDQGRFVCIRDVHCIMQARADERLMKLHRDAALITPDGMPLVWIGKRRKLPVSRTCGPNLIDRLHFQRRTPERNAADHQYGDKGNNVSPMPPLPPPTGLVAEVAVR